ncbi:MAG: glutamate-5-semialdehyde dehydrogenase [Pseudomonadota bacterium]
MRVLGADGAVHVVDGELAASLEPGDRLIANPQAGLLRVPAAVQETVTDAMTRVSAAFAALNAVDDAAIEVFFRVAAGRLADDAIWSAIGEVNAGDVERARARGRSTTRLEVSPAMRANMISGLEGWATMPTQRNAVLERIAHDDFDIELVGAALGPVGFVFEGRPNVLADACGVLRGGNTVVFRIGRDALATANKIMAEAIRPALIESGLPEDAVVLIERAEHAAGWSLFLDPRLALAVARGSGHSVDLLGSLAQSVGTPVSLHGTGGAWLVAGAAADADAFQAAVARSLDRKVCNTLNTCALPAARAGELIGPLLDGLTTAAERRGAPFKLHVTDSARPFVPQALFDREVAVQRAEGESFEPQAQAIDADQLGVEWEWENSPEITLTVCTDTAAAIAAFNRHSPRLVATLVSADAAEQEAFFEGIDAPFVGDDHTRWVDGQFALNKPELGLSNWAQGRLFGRGAVLTGDSVFTVRTRYRRR